MLKGRLGLETARIPHADRHGLIWLERGKLYVEDGNLTFVTAGTDSLKSGSYQIPYQSVSNILLAPGSTVSHDAFRLLATHGTGIIVVGTNGVRLYASMPFGPDRSDLARAQTRLWSNDDKRLAVAREMYKMRLEGEVRTEDDIETLRGIEGHRMKEVYRQLANQYGVQWEGRRYDRTNPQGDDLINTAINHASTAVRGAAMIAVRSTSTIPQLGFIHEAADVAFALDIADLYRTSVTLPVAFEAAKKCKDEGWESIERTTRRAAGKNLRTGEVIPRMIDDIKELLDVDDDGSHT
ncbi:MAG: type I-E CRISPR-associated endonuclease Cas1 [Planctomycetes bacterium]|nr:type I-E CRISPR-associated endonuclease Cas1 [Planctomycetota bacterium]